MDFLHQHINQFLEMPIESIKSILKITTIKKYNKGEHIFKSNEIPRYLYIVKTGIVRGYYANEKGKIYTSSLNIPVRVVRAFSSLIEKNPSLLSFDCLTDCEIYIMNYEEFEKLAKKDFHLLLLNSEILKAVYTRMEKRIHELSVLDAKQRYLNLQKDIPQIDNLIPQYQIASYLNITPVQLSRIRKEMFSK